MSSQTIFWIIGTAVVGGLWFQAGGALSGVIIGFLTGTIVELRQRLTKLEREVRGGVFQKQEAPAGVETEASAPALGSGLSEQLIDASEEESDAEEIPESVWAAAPLADGEYAQARQLDDEVRQNEAPELVVKIAEYVKLFFTTGNVVVRIGLIVLFFGVAFLLKYTASRGLIPIELRLCSVAAGGIALLAVGWRLRLRKPGYALLLQGGAVGVLYLTVFGAVKLYAMIPPLMALAIMVGIVVLSGMLAVLQNARSLAVFGATGGFLAPVLVSSGGGSHVMLFSYYALLNIGILGTAWYKSWCELNLTGFAFTFVIGSLWGVKYYRPDFFATTEPFLILFFLMYAAIAVLFALRQPPQLKGVVDGSLVFGLPLVAFGLQSALVDRFEYGLALSALTLGIFYIGLASALWKKETEGLRLLTESFLALGVVFGSLAVPFAFDRFWTAGAWALEGGALVWIGFRQRRILARCFGLLLQLGAGIAISSGSSAAPAAMPVVNAFFLGCLMICLAGFVSNYCHCFYRDRRMAWEQTAHAIIMAWAVMWWFGGGLREINVHAAEGHGVFAAMVFLCMSCGIMSFLHRKLSWSDLLYIPCGLVPALIILEAVAAVHGSNAHPFVRWGLAAWLPSVAITYYLLRRYEDAWPRVLLQAYHVAALLLWTITLTLEASFWIGQAVDGAQTWRFIMWCVVPGGIASALYAWGRRIDWPVRRFYQEYLCTATGIISGMLFIWSLAGCLLEGSPSPLAYLPLLNPLEIAQIAAFLLVCKWYLVNRESVASRRSVFFSLLGASGFLWLNAVIARATHFWAQVPFESSDIWNSYVFQTAAAILWTLTALGTMTFAARMASRRVWFTGAALLGLVVLKLFSIDLDGRGTVARIISFIVVGVLMLVVGYFSPLPPRREEEVAK